MFCPSCNELICRNAIKCILCGVHSHGFCTEITENGRLCKKCSQSPHKIERKMDAIEKLIKKELNTTVLDTDDLNFKVKPNKSKGKIHLASCVFKAKSEQKSFHICENCFKAKTDGTSLKRHHKKGCESIFKNIFYKTNEFEVYLIEGDKNIEECRNLCRLGKCFIKDKTLFYDVEMFEFYVIVIKKHVVGYFSKQKNLDKTNLSCIVVLPAYRGLGFAKNLVDLSYSICKFGSPERPLSKDGLFLFRKYWCDAVLNVIKNKKSVSIKQIVDESGINVEDVVFAMEVLGFVKNGVVKIGD